MTTPSHVVPNAVDHAFYTPGDGPRAGVFCAARIEPHKNQLELIRALEPTRLELTLAGSVHPHHADYYEACRRAAGPRVRFVEHTTGEALRELYRAARVHVLPSRFETTGLSSLEAALCGCSVVTTERGYAREYLRTHAYYCDPNDRASIRGAVVAAYDRPRRGLPERILANYTWAHTARATVGAYQRVLRTPRLADTPPATSSRE
ncbi:MAG: glycosyltransferase family 4 protein [Solirubrobacterales bacterium]|nr:glycosyltransferase family 4 protein [Solirubrobacterales bacterium]